MEPISAIVTALALGAAAGTKDIATQLVKDAYAALKALFKSRYPKVSVEQLEQAPESKNRRGVVEEDLQSSNAGHDQELVEAARKLIELILREAPQSAAVIGVDLKNIEAATLSLGGIVSAGTGVRVQSGKFENIEIHDVQAGVPGREAAKKT